MGKKGIRKKEIKQAQYGNISAQNENQWDDINNNKAVIIENIDNETRYADDIMICVARLCHTKEAKILYKIITGIDIKKVAAKNKKIYINVFLKIETQKQKV